MSSSGRDGSPGNFQDQNEQESIYPPDWLDPEQRRGHDWQYQQATHRSTGGLGTNIVTPHRRASASDRTEYDRHNPSSTWSPIRLGHDGEQLPYRQHQPYPAVLETLSFPPNPDQTASSASFSPQPDHHHTRSSSYPKQQLSTHGHKYQSPHSSTQPPAFSPRQGPHYYHQEQQGSGAASRSYSKQQHPQHHGYTQQGTTPTSKEPPATVFYIYGTGAVSNDDRSSSFESGQTPSTQSPHPAPASPSPGGYYSQHHEHHQTPSPASFQTTDTPPSFGHAQQYHHYSSPGQYQQQYPLRSTLHPPTPPSPHYQAALQTQEEEVAPPEYVYTITDKDVICGRGGKAISHVGNISFRALVREHQERYLTVRKKDKPAVAGHIVDLIRERGGRFLQRVKGERNAWEEINEIKAREKTSQALREGAPDLRKKIAEEPADDGGDTKKGKGIDGDCTPHTAEDKAKKQISRDANEKGKEAGNRSSDGKRRPSPEFREH